MGDFIIFLGSYVHSITPNEITCVENGIIAVKNGKIVAVIENNDLESLRKGLPHSDQIKIVKLNKNEFLCPGFIDLHIHAPQFPNAGLGYELTLLQWLNKYTFPLEQKYSDIEFARNVYKVVADKTLSNGTTTACYFATIHLESCIAFVNELVCSGQRALVGKVNMNMKCPPEYSETTSSSMEDTEIFVNYVSNLKNSLIKPVLTPRFALSCDFPLMNKLGELAKKHDLHIQTHISENKDEVEYVKELFPEFHHYADIYDCAGLLTRKTILAHGVHLTPAELKVLRDRGSAVAHCPISNTYLQSGVCDVRLLLNEGISVGLGTDVSGGYSPSILNCMKSAMNMSRYISFLQGNYSPLTYHEVFYLATLGGAKALQMDNIIGNFTIGKEFDALVINLNCQNSPVDFYNELPLPEKVQKFIYLGDDRNIKQVYVKGNLVKNKI